MQFSNTTYIDVHMKMDMWHEDPMMKACNMGFLFINKSCVSLPWHQIYLQLTQLRRYVALPSFGQITKFIKQLASNLEMDSFNKAIHILFCI